MAMVGDRPLEYKLVEIFDQPPVPPSPEALERDPNAQPVDVEGRRGQTLAWVEEQKKYVVETFEGDLVAIPEEHLREFEPAPVAEGGFDLAYPGSDGRAADFQEDVATALLERKYCVVQMSLKQADRKAAVRQVQDLDEWVRFMPEFEPVYMGQRPDGKRAQWYVGNASDIVTEFDALGDEAALPGIETADEHLKSLAVCVCNVSPYLGFNGVCRSNAMLHMNCANAEEEMNLLEDARTQAVGAGVIQGHLAFYHRRKVCMFYFVNGSGGSLTLHPADGSEEDITISCQEGQAVIFRHDLMDYTYLPEGRQLALQAWVFREQQAGECSLSQPELMAYADVIDAIPRGPVYGNNGKSVDNMSFCMRIPGMILSPENYWTGLQSGYDGVILIPLERWNHDFYWTPDPEMAGPLGKTYTRHMGLTDNNMQMMSFDNDFFGIPTEDVQKIDPPNRCMLEVGYDCLYRAGWTREKLQGASFSLVAGAASGEFAGHVMNGWRGQIFADSGTNLNMSVAAARFQYCLGMKGRCATIETACSSSLTAIALMHTHMRPDQAGQMKVGLKQEKNGIGFGANGHFDPFYMIGLCGAKMLSIQGRCFTFDQSGDGFVRGEGQAAMHFKTSEGEDLARLAMLCGSCMNQDGRSASLTAPHGPSQQECIRHSLREAAIPPLKIQMQELHGTGTALGDPIEVGALRATMMMFDGDIRDHPLVKTSSKSNIGHTELCAGICGIIKCVLMGIFCTACPNNHIRLLNPHIDSNAYPVYFCTECVDQGKNRGYGGVSSFGFGGSNARGDIWARCLAGPRNTDPGSVVSTRQLTQDRVFTWGEVSKQSIPRLGSTPHAENALDNLGDYDDAYMVGEQPGDDDELYVIGSFNGWTTCEKMTHVEEYGSYIFAMPLGETCVEQFQICMNKNEFFKIFPASKMANQDAIVLGPGMAPAGNRWVIDGRSQGLSQGTVYYISLQWDVETRKKTISWEPSLDVNVVGLAAELQPYRHRYFVLGSWTTWKPVEMMPARGEKPGTFETTVRVGIMRHEEFAFQRDGDKMQAIYPARQHDAAADRVNPIWSWTQAGVEAIAHDAEKYGHPKVGTAFTPEHLATARTGDLRLENISGGPSFKAFNNQSQVFEASIKAKPGAGGREGPRDLESLSGMGLISNAGTESVPVCGPDHLGEGKRWKFDGTMGESVKILLRVWEGEVAVTTVNSRAGIRTWTNQQVALRRKYYVTGTWNAFGFTPMESEGTNVHWLRVVMPQTQMVCFQIVVDEDKAQAIHPDMALTDQLMSPVMGPDAKGEGLYWGLGVERGEAIEIKLDLSQTDRRKVVTWTAA